MTMTPHPPGEVPRRRASDAGVGRPAGMAIAAVMAAVVFVVGRPFLPRPGQPRMEAPPTAPIATAPAPATQPSAPAAPVDAARAPDAALATATEGDAAAPTAAADDDAAATAVADAKPSSAAKPEPEERSEPAAKPSKGPAPPPAETQADKDIARAAWRANRPDIRVAGSRSMILIPIKGSPEGGSFRLLRKTRTVVITLPHGASLNTMHFYKLKRHGFLTLWTDQAETNARARDGTKLRLVLGVRADPQVELHEDFVRVIIPRPESAGGGGKPAEGSDDASGDGPQR